MLTRNQVSRQRLDRGIGALFLLLSLALPAQGVPVRPGDRSLRMGAEVPVLNRSGVRVGGFVQLDARIDSQQPLSDIPRFAQPAKAIQVEGGSLDVWPPAAHQSANLGVRQTQLFVEYMRPRIAGPWNMDGYLETGLSYPAFASDATAPTISLRYAFARLYNATAHVSMAAGQRQGPFNPLDPPVLNGGAMQYAGNTGIRSPQLEGEYSLGDFGLQAAAMRPVDPASDVTARGTDIVGRGQDAGVPELQGRLSWAPRFLDSVSYGDRIVPAEIGLSGRFSMSSYLPGTDQARRMSTWGVGMDVRMQFLKAIFVSGEAYTGRAMSRVYGLSGIAGTISTDSIPVFRPVVSTGETGGWLALGYQIMPGIRTNLVYGLSTPDASLLNRENAYQDTGFDVTRNESIAWNVLWNLLGSTTLGLEIGRISTGYVAPPKGTKSDGTLDSLQLSVSQGF